MPPIGFWFTGTAVYFFISAAYAIAVSLIGIRPMMAPKVFYVLLVVAVVLSILAWRTAAIQERDSSTQSKSISDLQNSNIAIAKSLLDQERKLTDLSLQNTNLSDSVSKIAKAASIDPNQSSQDVAARIVDKLSAQSAARQELADDEKRKRLVIANKLARFVTSGALIGQKFGNFGDTDAIKLEYNEWYGEVADYLLINLGPTYLAPFQSAIGGSLYLTGRSIEGGAIYNSLQARIQVLNNTIEKLQQ